MHVESKDAKLNILIFVYDKDWSNKSEDPKTTNGIGLDRLGAISSFLRWNQIKPIIIDSVSDLWFFNSIIRSTFFFFSNISKFCT